MLAKFAAMLDPDLLRAIASQAYTEMLLCGFTTVAEFHYLHRDSAANAAGMRMFGALADAAAQTGIRLTYVPVLYERAGFHAPRPEGPQALFAMSLEQFLEHHEEATGRRSERLSVGIGAHSLRAVSQLSLNEIQRAAGDGPIHLHIAEQQREVEQCLATCERRPVRWLLENVGVDEQWCLVHATHMDADETKDLAGSGAVVCVCPSTEANLGDGLFPLADYLAQGGRLAIGSDSHISINPFEELRWLEYGQRLALQSRNVVSFDDAHVGRELFLRVLEGGLQASSRAIAGIANAQALRATQFGLGEEWIDEGGRSTPSHEREFGAHLARLTGRTVVGELVARLPSLRLAGDPTRVASPFLWGRKTLPVTWS